MNATETDDPSPAGGAENQAATNPTQMPPAVPVGTHRSLVAPHAHGRRSRRAGSPLQRPVPHGVAASPPPDGGRRVVIVPIDPDGGHPSNPDRTSPPPRPQAALHEKAGSPGTRTPEFAERWQRGDASEPPVLRPRHRRWRLAVGLLVIVVAAWLTAVGLTRGSDDSGSPRSTTGPTTSSTAASSEVAPVAALEPLAATVRVLAGGPDALGNGGAAERSLLRRPTAVVRLRAGLAVADAGVLRLVRPDGRIEGIEIAGLARNFRIDHLAALANGTLLAVDESTARFAVVRGVGSPSVTAVPAAGPGIVSPVGVVGDGNGGALIADPGSGSVWRWSAVAPPTRLLTSLLAPVHVAALSDGGALVTDRGTGLVVRVDGNGPAEVIAADPTIASRVSGSPVILRSTPIAAVADGSDGVLVLMVDGSVSQFPLRPSADDRASPVTEYLAGATSLVADGRSTLIIAPGERRIQRLVVDNPGRATLSTVLGDVRWPRFDPDALLARDVVLIDPTGIAVRPGGSVVVADRGTNSIWQLEEDGSAKRLAGTGSWGDSADNPDAPASSIASPTDVAVGADGSVVFTEPEFGRIRAVLPDGSLVTLAEPRIAEPDLTLFSPGPLAVDGRGVVLSGDRFRGGMWALTSSGMRSVPGVGPPTRYVFAAADRNGSVVAMDAYGEAVRIEEGSVSAGAQDLVAVGEIVVAGTSDGVTILVATAPDGDGGGRRPGGSDDFPVIRRSAYDASRGARITAMASSRGRPLLATSGLRGAVVAADRDGEFPLTSTSIGDDEGRANETALSDPVALDAADDGTLLVTDRGSGRIRSLRAGRLATIAGNGGMSERNDQRANAFGQSLGDLRDAHTNRDGTVSVVDGHRVLRIDGAGLVNERVVRDPTGLVVNLRSIDEGPDGALLGVAEDGRLLRIDDDGSTILTEEPALAKVRVHTNGAIWAVTDAGRLVQLVGDRFVEVETPPDLAVIASDERDGRLGVVGRDGTVAVRAAGRWFRLRPSTTVTPDRRTNRLAEARPTDIAMLADGGIVIAVAGRDALLVYRTS